MVQKRYDHSQALDLKEISIWTHRFSWRLLVQLLTQANGAVQSSRRPRSMLLMKSVSFKDKTLPGTGAPKHVPEQSHGHALPQLSSGWLLRGWGSQVYPPDRNMRCNILCCLLKAGLDIPNLLVTVARGTTENECQTQPRAHALKMRTNRSLKLGRHRASLVAQW